MRRSLIVCSVALLCLTSAANAGPQEWRQKEIVPKPPEIVSAKDRALLMNRERAALHPGVPLDISGIEEGDNDFRARTPLLKQSTGEITLVDREENRRRRLAMYQERKSYATPLAIVSSTPVSRRVQVAAPVQPAKEPETPKKEPGALAQWLFALIGAGIAGSILLWRSVRT